MARKAHRFALKQKSFKIHSQKPAKKATKKVAKKRTKKS